MKAIHHSFNTKVAEQYGLNEAILIHNFQFWIQYNLANKTNRRNDRTWTYNSAGALLLLFPYLSIKKIRGAITSLVGRGVLIKANYNQSPYDRTAWYAFKNEEKWLNNQDSTTLPKGKMEKNEKENENNQKVKSHTDSKQIENTDRKGKSSCPYQELVNLYHKQMPDNPKVVKLTANRKAAIKSRWDEASKGIGTLFKYETTEEGLKQWDLFFSICSTSKFLTGSEPAGQGREKPFYANIDFIFRDSSFANILENKYH